MFKSIHTCDRCEDQFDEVYQANDHFAAKHCGVTQTPEGFFKAENEEGFNQWCYLRGFALVIWDGPGLYGTEGGYTCGGDYETNIYPLKKLCTWMASSIEDHQKKLERMIKALNDAHTETPG